MWNPEKVVIKGLMSHLDTEYEFKHGKCVMIYGDNQSDEGADSNGAGKSILLEGITLAITGEVSRDIDRSEFINDECDETYVSLLLSNPSSSIKKLLIERTIHRTKSAKVKISKNGVHDKEITSVPEANAEVYKLIGLTKQDLLSFFLLGQGKAFSFLTAGDAEKKEIIARFSDTNFILQKEEELKVINKNLDKEIVVLDAEILRNKERIDLLNEQLTDNSVDFEEEKEAKIKKIQIKIKRLEGEISEKDDQLDGYSKSLAKIKKEISATPDYQVKLDESIKKIKVQNNKLTKLEDNLSEIGIFRNHLLTLQQGKISCPKCKFKFILDKEIKLEEIPAFLEDLDAQEITLNADVEKAENIIAKYKKSKKEYEGNLEVLDDNMSEKKKLINKIKLHTESLEDLNEELKESKKRLKTIKESKPEKVDNKAKKDQISVYKANIKKLNGELADLRNEYEDNGFWIHHFSKKGFLSFLTNKSIKSIEGITNSYLQKINTNLQVQIDGFTELKKGNFSDKISVKILRSGKLIGTYARYSGGEKGRINISNIVGLQKLINMSCPNGGLNFLGLDEVFEGLDKTGQIEVVKILEDLGITTIVVSHMDKPIGVQNEVYIKKVNGVSKLLN